MLNKRVTVLNKAAARYNEFGKVGGDWVAEKVIWAGCSYVKGVKAMREGALDAYTTYMVRTDWHKELTEESRLSWAGETYQVLTLNGDREANEMQVTCQRVVK